MARFFIDRPVFAWVVSILIVLAGVMSITRLPVAQYPTVAPPSVSVSATYAGASAETVQDTVTSILEQQMTGLDNLQYMTASSSSSGGSSVSLYFLPGTNPDTAQVQAQNKVQMALPSLPATVQQQGVTVTKATRNFMMICSVACTNGTMDQFAVGNYISSSVLDPIRRVTGVGEASMFGTEYAMRIWMDPNKLNQFNLTSIDVSSAIAAQNAQVSAGQLGDLPAVRGQEMNVTLRAQSTLRTPAEFENILLKVNADGSKVLLRDVARVALGGQSYTMLARAMGNPGAGIAIKLSPSANALSTATAVREKMKELSRFFPPGLTVDYPMDSSTFINISVEEVVKTLIEAIILVFLVVFLFLQSIRATLIPTIVIPVALLGAFASMYVFGFSINVLTLFGIVLAIGMLVDDAIVVVENVERIMSEEGLSPREATRKAMDQITGALIGITLVLTAVFIPMAFFSGSVGTIYRQFSLSLVSAMVLSVFLAMSLTPALCAHMLPAVEKGHKQAKRGFFGWFNREFAATAKKYQGWVGGWIKRPFRCMMLYAALVAATGWAEELWAVPGRQGADEVLELPRAHRVHAAGGFVQHKDAGFAREEACEADTAFFALAQVMGQAALKPCQPHLRQRALNPLCNLRGINPQLPRAESHVFRHGGAEQLVVRILEEEPDHSVHFVEIRVRDPFAADDNFPLTAVVLGEYPVQMEEEG